MEGCVRGAAEAGPPGPDPVERAITRVERLVFRSDLLAIASMRCPSSDPLFSDMGAIRNAVFVFPRTDVRIQLDGAPAFRADPNLVTFYNAGQVYRRYAVGGAPDECDWYWIEPATLREVLARCDPEGADREAPFRFAWGPCDPRCYLEQRRALLHASTADEPDRLYLEEAMIWILDRLVRDALRLRARAATRRGAPSRQHIELVEGAKDFLAERARERLDLSALARELGCSPYHLCHVFRRQTGTTLSEYQHQLRLRRSLQQVADRGIRLTDLALELGYASHSHFTYFFRRAFGVTPAALRSKFLATPGRIHPMLG
jgi:AraC family transcriptional regulator